MHFSSIPPYLQARLFTILISASLLLATSVLWTPRAGFSGFAQLWEKYLLNIGGPFEEWISRLAAIEANTSIKPDHFLQTSIQHLISRDWICGIHWTGDNQDHFSGKKSSHIVDFGDEKLKITL